MGEYGEKKPVYTALTDRNKKPKLKSRLRVIPDVPENKGGKHRATEEKEDGR